MALENRKQCELLAAQLVRAEEMTLGAIKDFPADRWFLQIAPEKAHANWLLGHMTQALNNAVLKFCYGGAWIIGPEWGDLYGPAHRGGRLPTSDPTGYKPAEEITEWYSKSMAAVLTRLQDFSDDNLTEPPRGMLPENISAPFANCGKLLSHIIQHDAYHRGQIMVLKTMDR